MIVSKRNRLASKLTPKGRAALKAVHDCGAIAAVWNNAGFEELRLAGLCWSKPLGNGRYLHKRWSNIHKGVTE